MADPAPVRGIHRRADEDQRAHLLRVALGECERDLAAERVRDEGGRTAARADELGEHVRKLVERQRPSRVLALPPAGEVGDRDAERAAEDPPERLEILAGDAEPVDEHERVAGAGLADVEPVAADLAPA